MYFEVTDKERDYLLKIIDHFVTSNSHLEKEVIADVMMMYWRLHRSRDETSTSGS